MAGTKRPRFTRADLDAILTALAAISAGEWEADTYGPRPDFEGVIAKVQAAKLAGQNRRYYMA